MNTAKKIYCRIFQGAMRLALPVLPYRDPVLLNGMQEVAETLSKEQKKLPCAEKSQNFKTIVLDCACVQIIERHLPEKEVARTHKVEWNSDAA